jgi:oligoendopeptidase F
VSQHTAAAAGVRWDLSDLFASHDDPAIAATLTACRTRAEEFAGRYRGTILVPGGPAPDHLLGAILEVEGIQADLERVGAFAGLLYASDTSRPSSGTCGTGRQHLTRSKPGAFFELEWLQVLGRGRCSHHPAPAGYRHFLRQARQTPAHSVGAGRAPPERAGQHRPARSAACSRATSVWLSPGATAGRSGSP